MGDVRQLLTTWSSQGQVPGKLVGVHPGGLVFVVVLKGPFEKVGSCEVFDLTQINPEMIKRCKKMLALFSPAGFTV